MVAVWQRGVGFLWVGLKQHTQSQPIWKCVSTTIDRHRTMFIFYIYEHLSLGVTLCVFVGKGDAGRWRRFTALIKNWLVVGNVAWMMSWNCPDSDAVIYHTILESRTRASVKKRKIDDKDKFSQAVLCSVGCVHVHPHVLARKANKCTFGYFLFRLGCYTNLLPPRWCIVPPALHQYV